MLRRMDTATFERLLGAWIIQAVAALPETLDFVRGHLSLAAFIVCLNYLVPSFDRGR